MPKDTADGESAILSAIASWSEPYRSIGSRIHEIIKASAPSLQPKTWYGMPGYAQNGKVICYFRGGDKFKERYLTLGFNDTAKLDNGVMWPISYAITELTAAEETKIAELVKKAAGTPG